MIISQVSMGLLSAGSVATAFHEASVEPLTNRRDPWTRHERLLKEIGLAN